MSKCKSCGGRYTASSPHQKFCSDRCRWREHKRKTYESRKEEGLCPQCGGEMEEDNTASYCEECQSYFKDRYYKIKKTL